VAVRVPIRVDDPQNIIDTYGAGAKVRIERATVATMSGAAEITSFAIDVDPDPVTEYEYTDATGIQGTHWYWTRFSTATPTDAAHYSGYSEPWLAGGLTGGCITVESAKTWSSIADTADDPWLPLAVGAINRAGVGILGLDLGPSPDTTRTYDACEATEQGRTLWIPGGIRAFTTVEVSADGSTWTDVTSDVRIGPAAHLRPPGEPGAYIEFLLYVSGSVDSFAGYLYVRITGPAFG
jgi:hypothetical protein